MSRHDGEDLPVLGYALQLMRAPAVEPERRSSNEIFDRPRDEDFARSRKSRDPSADVHGDPADIAILSLFQLAGVQAGPDQLRIVSKARRNQMIRLVSEVAHYSENLVEPGGLRFHGDYKAPRNAWANRRAPISSLPLYHI